jgi:hypothetical protein
MYFIAHTLFEDESRKFSLALDLEYRAKLKKKRKEENLCGDLEKFLLLSPQTHCRLFPEQFSLSRFFR